MMRNKRGVELSMNVVIIAILVILVLIVVSVFFLGGFTTLSNKIKDIFGITKGTDVPIAIESCKSKCSLAEQTNSNDVFCKATFRIDANNDGTADYTEEDGNKKYIEYHCYDSPISTTCPDITCPGQ